MILSMSNYFLQHSKGLSTSIALYRSKSDALLPPQREKAPLLPPTSPSLRTLQLQKCQRLSMAKQNHHISSRFRLQRHLQFHYSPTCTFPHKDIPESHHIAAGAAAGHRIPRRCFLFSASVLDVGLH